MICSFDKVPVPRVTVVLSSFNHEAFVGEAITNVLEQSFGDFELFVIDDNSNDGSWAVIQYVFL